MCRDCSQCAPCCLKRLSNTLLCLVGSPTAGVLTESVRASVRSPLLQFLVSSLDRHRGEGVAPKENLVDF